MFDALLDFLANQADYLSFAEGMILASLGIVCLIMGRGRQESGWHGMALFGGLLAINRWMGLAEQIPNIPFYFATIRFLLELMAFASLLHFAYWGERKVRRIFAAGVIFSLLAIVLVGILQKRFSTASVSFGTLEWVAGGWAGGALFIMSQKVPGPAGRRLRIAAIPLVLYGIAVGGPSLMSENSRSSHDLLFLLVRLIRPLLMAALVWLIAVSARADDDKSRTSRRSLFDLSPMAWGLVIGGIMLVVCFELVNMAGAYGARMHRRALLLRAQTAAAVIPQEWVQQLVKSKVSERSPVFIQTEKMLRDIRSRNLDVHFVYLLVVKETGDIIYLVTSEPPDSHDAPQPGQMYENANDALWGMFEGGYAFADGAMENRGGWLCAFAAVHSSNTTRPSAVLGMDTDLRNVHQTIVRHRLAGIGLSLVLNLLVLALFSGLQLNKDWTQTTSSLERRFRAVFENAAESIFVFEVATGRIRMANPFACEWLGYQPEEAFALSIQDVAKGSLEEIRKRLFSGRKIGEEYVFRRKDGSFVSGEMTGAALRLQEADCIVAFARDITARKKSEAELQRSLADLARFNRLMVGRETRVMELKQEVNALCRSLSRTPTYSSVEKSAAPATTKDPEVPA
jgi:PAS domain S-box-containing protein